MTSNEVAAAVREWVRETLPALQAGYTYTPSKKGPLPDVITDIGDTAVGRDFPEFPWQQLQNAWVRLWRVSISLMVVNNPPDVAADQLRDFVDALIADAKENGSLGGRVQFISPELSFDFSTPFVQYQDGTKGREVVGQIAVGELIDVEDES